MKLDLRGLEISPSGEEKALPFRRSLDLSSLSWWGEHPWTEPVDVEGTVVNRGDFYELDYTARGVLHFRCARCLQPVERPQELSFQHTAMETETDPTEVDGFLPIYGGQLDILQAVSDDLLLELGEPALCRPDCAGLCPVCGGLREDCDCSTELPDPRFDALRALMEDEPE